ncbi:ABC transporter substrate-binding protein [Paenibacillus sp. UNC451MF]|uniref:ABC transporter substrate-binding protein n=1 Tax=Paenibacillus sp. UNC451MF TaxID=1449063 RepID=UPI00048C2D69|nr:extracellular solute-binding protein [Paenibacillus sp. UNC451MF]
MLKTKVSSKSSAIVLLAALIGCSNGEMKNSQPMDSINVSKEPIKISVYDYQAGFNDRELQTYIINPIQAKFPNISFELLKAKSPEELVASGVVPDLVFTSNVYVKYMLDLKLGEDLQKLVKNKNINLDRFEPEAVNVLKRFGPKGEIYALPISMNYGVMLYNKDIFDKFAVPYPKDEMTWSQTIELSKKLTRTEEGIRYIGVATGAAQGLVLQRAMSVVDEKQENPVIASEDGFKKIFTMLRQLFDMNGYVGPNKEFNYGSNEFFKTQTLGMHPTWIAGVTDSLVQMEKEGKAFNWDLVSYPSADDRPNFGKQIDFHLMMVPEASHNKEAAYEIMQTLMTDEAQSAMNKAGRMTVLKDQQLKKQYAVDLKVYEGKNLEGAFKAKPGPTAVSTDYDVKIFSILQESVKDMAVSNMDVNTALRTADEKASKYIQEMKLQRK